MVSSSSIAARPVSAAKRSVNESAQIQTSTFAASGLSPGPERTLREPGQAPALVDPGRSLREPGDRAAAQQGVGQPGRRHPGPARQLAEGVVRARPHLVPVLLGEGLGLVRRHVDARGAVTRAALARQAQVQRLVDGGVVEVERPVDDVLEDVGASPRRVLLLAGGQERRAHHPAARRRCCRRCTCRRRCSGGPPRRATRGRG